MPGLIGYMLTIVITLGGYLAGLHWLVSPPDPWRPDPKTVQIAQQSRKRLPPPVKPVQASAPADVTEPVETDGKPASVEMSAAPALIDASETIGRTEPISVEATRPAEPARIAHRDAPPVKIRSSVRKRVERTTNRKLELMVLRTYERSDGRRFTRLLPMSSARNALAFQPDDGW